MSKFLLAAILLLMVAATSRAISCDEMRGKNNSLTAWTDMEPHTVESCHNYENHMHVTQRITFTHPDARGIRVDFDNKSSLGSGDTLTAKLLLSYGRFENTYRGDYFQSIMTHAMTLEFEFYSNGTDVDYGFKFTATPLDYYFSAKFLSDITQRSVSNLPEFAPCQVVDFERRCRKDSEHAVPVEHVEVNYKNAEGKLSSYHFTGSDSVDMAIGTNGTSVHYEPESGFCESENAQIEETRRAEIAANILMSKFGFWKE